MFSAYFVRLGGPIAQHHQIPSSQHPLALACLRSPEGAICQQRDCFEVHSSALQTQAANPCLAVLFAEVGTSLSHVPTLIKGPIEMQTQNKALTSQMRKFLGSRLQQGRYKAKEANEEIMPSFFTCVSYSCLIKGWHGCVPTCKFFSTLSFR